MALCRVGEDSQPGWVSAQFIRPGGSRTDANNALPILQDLADLNAVTAPQTDDAAVDAAPADEDDAVDATTLTLAIDQNPTFVTQGDSIELRFTVTNNGESDATNSSLAINCLPDCNPYFDRRRRRWNSRPIRERRQQIVRFVWPQLAAGGFPPPQSFRSRSTAICRPVR